MFQSPTASVHTNLSIPPCHTPPPRVMNGRHMPHCLVAGRQLMTNWAGHTQLRQPPGRFQTHLIRRAHLSAEYIARPGPRPLLDWPINKFLTTRQRRRTHTHIPSVLSRQRCKARFWVNKLLDTCTKFDLISHSVDTFIIGRVANNIQVEAVY